MVKNSDQTDPQGFALGRENLKLMLIGLGIIILGFALMTGGKSNDPNVFNKEVIFSFRRITLAPLVVVFGFLFEIYAIMKKTKSKG
ncbi:MAG: DUF3098 domain-containing protein [Marinilabiliales bacterium]|nr:DUF3098 domain-containing protein [Marinilabiliales bacterium]